MFRRPAIQRDVFVERRRATIVPFIHLLRGLLLPVPGVIRRLAPTSPLGTWRPTRTGTTRAALVLPQDVPHVATVTQSRTVVTRTSLVADASGEETEVRVLGRPSRRRRVPTTRLLPEAARRVAIPPVPVRAGPVPLTIRLPRTGVARAVAAAAVLVAAVAGELPVAAAPRH